MPSARRQCQRVLRLAGAAAQPARALEVETVDSTGAPQAWTLADEGDLDSVFHFDAGEAYTEERLNLDQEQKLRVVAAAGTFELITWTR